MPLFDLKNAKKKLISPSLTSLGLRKTQSTGNIEDSVIIVKRPSNEKIATVSILRTSSRSGATSDQKRTRAPLSQSDIVLATVMEDDDGDDADHNNLRLAAKLREITACDMDLLLSLETQARMDAQEEKERKIQGTNSITTTKRPSRLKFDIPATPARSKSPDPKSLHATRQRSWSLPLEDAKKKTNRLSKWGRLISQQQQEEAKHNQLMYNTDSSSSEDDCSTPDNNNNNNSCDLQTDIVIGSKVKLLKRPLLIIGTVKYMGKVHFDKGEWLGIELDSRVGNTDGKIGDIRYFQTKLDYSIFVKKEDTIKV